LKIVRAIAIVALAFLAVTAVMGAVLLLRDPSGQPMDIPQGVLQYSPFHSFLIPGIILLVSQGLLSVAVLAIAVLCKRGFGWWIGFQGCVLFCWITIEVILLRTVVWLHYVYWGLALILIACGWMLHRQERSTPAPSYETVPASRH
jgi:preprotein translocase subunit SecG